MKRLMPSFSLALLNKVNLEPDLRARQFHVALAIGKVVEFHLRALRVLRGNSLPFSASEQSD